MVNTQTFQKHLEYYVSAIILKTLDPKLILELVGLVTRELLTDFLTMDGPSLILLSPN